MGGMPIAAGECHVNGVTRRDGALDFHAWLRQADYVVTGGGDLERYTVLSAFE